MRGFITLEMSGLTYGTSDLMDRFFVFYVTSNTLSGVPTDIAMVMRFLQLL